MNDEPVVYLDVDMEIEDNDLEIDGDITETIELVDGVRDYRQLTNKPSINNVPLNDNYNEIDPTVPQWAKEPNKPHYNASEVGAMAEGSAYLKSEVDAMVNPKANASDVYNKTTVDTLLSQKVNTVSGMGLSHNDFTDTDKQKLDKAITDVSDKADKTNTYTKDEVDTKISGIKVDAYTKSETDTLLNAKANASETYTKAEVNNLIDGMSIDIITDSEISTIINKYF